MYLVTRQDLEPGAQSTQLSHSLTEFFILYPEIIRNWYHTSNYLINLSVKNETELESLIQKAQSKDIKIAIFREPDLGNQITAIALEPSEATRKLCSSFPKALREYSQTGKEVSHAA
jgi:peptidyl-tRNA hydrolase